MHANASIKHPSQVIDKKTARNAVGEEAITRFQDLLIAKDVIRLQARSEATAT